MAALVDPVFLAAKAAVACSAAVVLTRAAGVDDALSAGFVALACTTPSAHAGLRRGLEQLAGSAVGWAASGALLMALPGARGAAWAVCASLGASVYGCFLLGMGSAYLVSGFTALYVHVLPFSSPGSALATRLFAVLVGVASATAVNTAVSAVSVARGGGIVERRTRIARAAVASELRALAGALGPGAGAKRPSFEAAFEALSELRGDLRDAARERLFPGAPRARELAARALSSAECLETLAHLGKEAALLGRQGGEGARELAAALELSASELEAHAPAGPGGARERLAAASKALEQGGEPLLAATARRMAEALEGSLSAGP